MKYSLFLFTGLAIIFTSCFDAPEFPDTPKIKFNNIKFKNVGSNSDADSLIIFIDFEDGDGDLGLDPSMLDFPFQQKSYFNNKTGGLYTFTNESSEDLMTLADRAVIDSLPPYSGDAICLNWDTNPDIKYTDGTQLKDTVYFQFNPRHYNIFVNYYVDRGSGFERFIWRLEIDCSTNYNGRFPILNSENEKRALEGTLKYGMVSVGFKSIFKDDLMKLKITILDRQGRYSNTVETPPFRLSEID